MPRYFPKSTYQIKEASAGEFVYKKSRKPFRGKYVHTSDNKFFAGENTLRLGPELIKPDLDIDNFGQLREVKKYHILQPETYQDLKDNEFLVPSKTIPTEKDYEKGYVIRYFIRKNNDNNIIFEISKKIYNDIINKQQHDANLYSVGTIRWSLTGDVSKTNFNTLLRKSRIYPKIVVAFSKLDEFYKTPEFDESKDLQPNIVGRFYPDGEFVPANLPSSYKVSPNDGVQKCSNCVFFNENYCKGWKAPVRNAYWCVSWQVNPDTYEDSNVEEFLAEAERARLLQEQKNAIFEQLNQSSNERNKNSKFLSLFNKNNQNEFFPFDAPGEEIGEKKFFPERIRALSQFAKNNQTLYEWNGTEWIAIQGPTSTNEENN